jgi:hypothetical protein
MANMRDGTAEGLVAFLDWMIAKGLVKSATGNSYKSAALKVFEVEGEGWRSVDVRTLDVESLLHRFENVSGHNYTPGSLTTYRGRFERALEQYLAFLESPSAFRPSVSPRRRVVNSADEAAAPVPEVPPAASTVRNELVPPDRHLSDLIEYTFPLRSGDTAYFRLPRTFASTEVDRMVGFLRALAMDDDLRPSQHET